MMHVYCDTHVYDVFLRLDPIAFGQFKKLKRSGTRFHGSAENLEELAANANRPEQAWHSLRIFEEIRSPRCFLKAPDDLVRDEINAFLSNSEFSPFMTRKEAEHFQDIAQQIVRSDERYKLRELDQSTKKAHRLDGQAMADSLLANPKYRRDGTFAQWWEQSIRSVVETSCESLAIPISNAPRLVEGLNQLPSLRTQAVTVIACAISWLNNHRPDKGFSFDLKHALLASHSDILLCNDDRFLRLLAIGAEQLPFKAMRPADFLGSFSADEA